MRTLIVHVLLNLALVFTISAQDELREPFLLERFASEGNNIQTILSGEELDLAREQLIAEAKTSIYLSTFSISTDRFGKKFHHILCKKAKEGLDVRVIVDHRANKNFFDLLMNIKECGAYVIAFRPGDRWYALHEKLLIADGNKVILGGSGYSHKYFLAAPDSHKPEKREKFSNKKGWYDIDYKVQGQLACDFHHQFRTQFISLAQKWADYNPEYWWYGPKNFAQIMHKYYGFGRFKNCSNVNKKAGPANGMAFLNSPYKDSKRDLLKAHIESLDKLSAGEQVFLYAPYFVPGKKQVDALVRALKRGVQISVITNSVDSTDEGRFSRILFMGMVHMVNPAIKAGMKLYLWEAKSTIHRKGGLYGNVAFIGSDNWDNRAQEYQSESVLFTDDERLVLEFHRHFARDLEHASLIQQSDIDEVFRQSSKLDRFVGRKLKQFF